MIKLYEIEVVVTRSVRDTFNVLAPNMCRAIETAHKAFLEVNEESTILTTSARLLDTIIAPNTADYDELVVIRGVFEKLIGRSYSLTASETTVYHKLTKHIGEK